jgi:hypothetical protein
MSMRPSLLALSLGAALFPACADQQESLIVLHAPFWPEDGACSVDPSVEEGLLRGTLDVTQGTPYLMPAAVLNNLAAQDATDNNAGIITNEVQITGASVKLESAQDPVMIDVLEDMNDALVDFDVDVASVSVPPGEIAGFAVEVISEEASKQMGAYLLAEHGAEAQLIVTAKVVFHGLRAGTSVGKIGILDAREFSFPIQLCQGCLLDCSGCPDDSFCTITPGQFSGGVCGNAQDFGIAPPGCELDQ